MVWGELLGCSLLLIRWFGLSSCLEKGHALHDSIHMDIGDYSPAASCGGLKGLVQLQHCWARFWRELLCVTHVTCAHELCSSWLRGASCLWTMPLPWLMGNHPGKDAESITSLSCRGPVHCNTCFLKGCLGIPNPFFSPWRKTSYFSSRNQHGLVNSKSQHIVVFPVCFPHSSQCVKCAPWGDFPWAWSKSPFICASLLPCRVFVCVK